MKKDPFKPLFWLTLAFIFKGLLFIGVILNHPYHDIPGIWGATQSDDSSYLVPIDNLLLHGAYSPDFRMPGYGVVYLFFRLVFDQAGACNAIIILQFMLASVSVYYLALTALNIFKNNAVFYLTFYIFLICSFSNFFDAYISTESLCSSLLILSVYNFTLYFNSPKSKYLFYAGLLAVWVMFIRPVFGGVLPMFGLLILFQKNNNLKVKIKHVLLFLIPFLICECSWVFRNYQVHKKFIPFTTTGSFYPDAATTYLQPLFEFTQSWGGACSYGNNPPDLNWFNYYYPGMKGVLKYDSLPADIYTSAFNKDSLLHLKGMIIALRNPSIDSVTARNFQNQLRSKLYTYKLSVEREKPFTFYVKAPLKIMGVLLYGPHTLEFLDRGQNIPIFGRYIALFNRLIYCITLFCGLIGIILLIIIGLKQSISFLTIPLIPLFTIIIHPFLFRFFDSRFLMPAYPFLILCAAYLLNKIYSHYIQPAFKG